ncbi:arsenate reductase family protein [Roseovarius sp. SYSU LYC5161]|jgi:Spx/MgsR family transcriptional regulator|uniref:arsenate reductase family protein n=1 Tax=Roseovarius halophilus (ex Wu et al. 2025) TaxID=3376060 RepID=UPI00399A4658
MRLFGLKSCDTCRKALKALRAAGHDPQVIDVRADGIAAEDLQAILDHFGDSALNTRSTTWRALSEPERQRPAADLLTTHPTLLKRPVIEAQGQWHQGWGASVQHALLQ